MRPEESLLEEPGRLDTERACESNKRGEGQVHLAPLDLLPVAPMKPGAMGCLFERELRALTQPSDIRRERSS